MKIWYLTEIKGVHIGLSMCFIGLAFGAEVNKDPVDHRNVKGMVEKYLAKYSGIMDSSRDKDVVIFLGNTGAGKSTVINYVSGKDPK